MYGGFARFGPDHVPGRKQLVKSIDGGITWTSVSLGLPPYLDVNALLIDPQNPNTLYARMGPGNGGVDVNFVNLFKSMDGGATWRPLGSDKLARVDISLLALDPQSPNILYAQTNSFRSTGPALFKSIDGGNTWSNVQTPSDIGGYWSFAVDPQNAGTMYAGAPTGMVKTTDGGASWRLILSLPVHVVVIDPQNPTTVYAGSSEGLYRSTDGGDNWSAVRNGQPASLYVSTLVIDPQTPGKIYAGTLSGGVFATFASPVLTLDRASYCIGDSWILRVSNAAPNAAIRLSGTSNRQTWEVVPWQMTDGSGTHEERGTMTQDNQGSHTLRVDVDGLISNTLSFSVQNCRS
jgi:photosystem II stability/assembly factor-like uncharacterized protein